MFEVLNDIIPTNEDPGKRDRCAWCDVKINYC